MLSPNGKYEIIENSRDDDSYMYSNTDYTFSLVVVATGDCLKEWYGTWNQDAHGEDKRGIDWVSFSETNDKAIAHGYDGKTEEFLLPENVDVVDNGEKISLTWKDGRTEIRERSRVFYTTKYGQIFSPRELKNPPSPKKTKVSKKKSKAVK